jgi:hypothetical protein
VRPDNGWFSAVLAAGPAEGRPLDVFIAGDDTNFFLGVSILS